MAQRTIYTDDLTNEEGAEPVLFSFDGKHYTIDLAPTSKKALQEALQRFIKAAKEVRGPSATAPTKAKGGLSEGQQARAWFKANGLEVSSRGRAKPEEIQRWKDALKA